MAIKRKQNFLGNQRIETSYLKSMEAAVSDDFSSFFNGVFGNGTSNYIIRGFDHNGSSTPSKAAFFIDLADSVLASKIPDASIYQIPSTETRWYPLVSVTPGTYRVGLTLNQVTSDSDPQPAKFIDTITGKEITKSVPLAILQSHSLVVLGVSDPVPANTFLIYQVVVNSSSVVSGVTLAEGTKYFFLNLDGSHEGSLNEWIDTLISGDFFVTMDGDVTGRSDDSTVVAIQNVPVSDTLPTTAGQVMGYNGSKWGPYNLPVKSIASSDSTITVVNTSGSVDVKLTAPVAVSKGGTGLNASGVTSGQILVGVDSGGGFKLQDVNGDASMTNLGKVTVEGLQGNPVGSGTLGLSDAGKLLAWSGSAWAPASFQGGGGGSGAVYYFNFANGESPAPASSRELSTQYDAHASWTSSVTTVANDANGTLISTFVTKLNSPSVEVIPAGIWDLNIWLASDGAPNDTAVRVKVGVWNGSTFTLKATSDYVYITGIANTTNEYKVSVYVSEIDTALSDRVEIQVEGRRFASPTHTVTGYYGNGTISHIHTNINAAGGTGLMKVVNGYLQSPASLLVNADVAPAGTANIAVNKLADGIGGHVLVGQGGSVGPAYVGISGDATLIADGTFTLNTVPVSKGGTGQTTLTAGAILLGNSTSAVSSLVGTNTSHFPRWDGSAWVNGFLSDLDWNSITPSTNITLYPAPSALSGKSVAIYGGDGLDGNGGDVGIISGAGSVGAFSGNLILTTAANLTGNSGSCVLDVGNAIGTFGVVSIGTTNASGVFIGRAGKSTTFSGTIHINPLTASLPLKLNALNDVVSAAIDLSSSEVTGTLPVTNGGTGITSVSSRQILYGSTTLTNTLVAGTLSNLDWSLIAPSTAVSIAAAAGQNATFRAGSNANTTILGGAGGFLYLDSGTGLSNNIVYVGHTNALGVEIGRTGIVTTVHGSLALDNALSPLYGGTGLSSYATGDLLYASATNVLSRLARGTNGQYLSLSGGLPVWTSAAIAGTQTGVFTQTPSTNPTITSVNDQINPNAGIVKISANGSYTLNSAPTILTSGVAEGTRVTIINIGANTITLKADGATATKLKLSGATVQVKQYTVIEFIYINDGTASYWCEVTHTQ